MNDDEAVREVGWVARRAREIVLTPIGQEDPAEMLEFYERKAALLRHIGEDEMAAHADSQAAAWRPGGAFYRPATTGAAPTR